MKSNSTVIDKDGSDTKKRKRRSEPPPKYKVIYHNDDYTPIEFVTWSLRAFFNKEEHEANSITLEIHKLGAACVGLYDYQIAEQKIYEVLESAREHEYPLKVTGEPE